MRRTMMRTTILEMIALLVLAFCIAMLHHSLSSSGITIFKKRPAAGPSTTFMMNRGGTAHGG